MKMHVFQIVPPLEGDKALADDWDYEVLITDDHGGLLCGPFFSSSGYGTRVSAEAACARRGRLAVDLLLMTLN